MAAPVGTWPTYRGRAAALEGNYRPEDSGGAGPAREAIAGEPDVVELPGQGGEAQAAITFCNCAPESPTGRRSLFYDDAGLQSRKENRPAGSVVETAAAMGLRLLSEAEYLALQTLGPFDQKTSSWLLTPEALRREGGALFGDYR